LKAIPKARFSNRLPNGDYLSLTVWPGKKDPIAEVLTVQIRRLNNDNWETVGRLAVYRTGNGQYSQLPERQPQPSEDEAMEKKRDSDFSGGFFT
jgi:hypothetical protein